MTDNKTDFLIAGAGIMGLTVARELKRRLPRCRITLLEKEDHVGAHASGRNSGVLHSGIYYTPGTLKARFCAEGARRMLAYVKSKGLPFRVPGKLIVASGEDDLPGLDRLMSNAKGNGLRVELLGSQQVREREPFAAAWPGVFCHDTAVVDPKIIVGSLVQDLIGEGVNVLFQKDVVSLDAETREVVTQSGERFRFEFFINCGGANADRIATLFGLAKAFILLPFKGLYFKLKKESDGLVKESIYPVPNLNFPFLGVHLTRSVSGDVYVGPTAIPAFGRENYGVLSGVRVGEAFPILWQLGRLYCSRDAQFRRLVHSEVGKYFKSGFLKAARRLVPSLKPSDLIPATKVGIRPQFINRSTARLEMDFHIERTSHSLHVLNAISPAFTCSLAFSEFLVEKIISGGDLPCKN